MQNKVYILVVFNLAILFLLATSSMNESLAAEPSQKGPVFNLSSSRIQIAQSGATTSKPPSPEKPPSTTGVQGRSTGLCVSPEGLRIPCPESYSGARTRGFTSDPLAEREKALQARKKMLLRSLSEVEMELEQLQNLRKGKPSPPNPPR